MFEYQTLDINYQKNGEVLLGKTIDYGVCSACGTIFQLALPSEKELSDYYRMNQTSESYVESEKQIKQSSFKDRIQFLKEKTDLVGGKALEVGASNGAFLTLLKDQMKMEVLGIEPSEKNRYLARDLFDIHMMPGTLEEIDIEMHGFFEAFELVVSRNVLEHVRDPKKFLKKLVHTVKPSGYLFLEVPSTEYATRVVRSNRGKDIEPVHLSHFLGSGIVSVLTKLDMALLHLSNSVDFKNPSLQILSRKVKLDEQGKEVFLKQVKGFHALLESTSLRLKSVIAKNRSVALWGAGADLYEVFARYPELVELRQYTLVDRNSLKQGKKMFGLLVKDPKVLRSMNIDCVVITPNNRSLQLEIQKDLNSYLPEIQYVNLFE